MKKKHKIVTFLINEGKVHNVQGTNLGDTFPDTGPLSGEKTVLARSSTEQPSNEAAF